MKYIRRFMFFIVIVAILCSFDCAKVGFETVAEQSGMTELESTLLLLVEAQKELISTYEAVIANLKDDNKSLKDENASLIGKTDALSSYVGTLNARIATLETEVQQKQEQYDTLVTQTSDITAIIAGYEEKISGYESQIDSYKQQLAETQQRCEQMLGVKTRIIEELSRELRRTNISVDVDENGAISLSGGTLFASGKTDLQESGMAYLDSVLPVYFNVLMSDEFRPFIAEIVIEGHTDSTAKAGEDPYLYNLKLSQERAFMVANYVLRDEYMTYSLRLDSGKSAALRTLVSATGRSFSALKYDQYGNEDKDASRRIEIKFRLKDVQ